MTGYKDPPKEHQFKKGVVTNPKGRATGSRNASTIINELLAIKVRTKNPLNGDDNEVKLRVDEAIWLKQIKKALDGDGNATDRLYDRTEGKPLQKQLNAETTMAELLNALDRQEAEDG